MFRLACQRYRAAYAGLPRDVWLLAVVLFVNRCGSMAMTFMTLYLTSQLEMNEAAAGQMIGMFGLGAVGGALASGRLAERFGPIRVQTVGMLCTATGFLVIPMWQTASPIAATMCLLGTASEAVRTANATAIAKLTTSANRTRAFALNRLAANLGFSFGPAIGGVLATIHFGLLFVVDALTTLAAAIALGYAFRGRRIAVAPTDAAAPPLRISPLRDGTFVVFLGLILASLLVFFQFGSTYPLYLRDHYGLSKPQIGLMFAVNTSIIVFFEMVLIDVIKHWPLLRTVGWGCFLSCLGFGLLPLGDTIGYAVFAMIVLTAGEMLSFALSAGFVANRSPSGGEGAYLSWYTGMFALAAVLGPTVGSAIYQWNPSVLWAASAGVGALVLIGFHWLSLATRGRTAAHGVVSDLPPIAAEACDGVAT